MLAIVAGTLASTAAVVEHADRVRQGLVATYFADTEWSSSPVRTSIETPSTAAMTDAWHGARPERFSVTWTGSFVALTSREYTFTTASDDGSWVYVDGQLVVDNGGRHERHVVSARVRLDRGVHEIFIKYFQDGGDATFECPSIPPWALWSHQAEFAHLAARVAAWWLLRTGLLVSWIAAVAAALAALLATRRRWLAPLVAVVAASTALNVIAITWGLPSAWIGDELIPASVLTALSHGFINGWFDRYPPLHFYVLTIADMPWLVLNNLEWLPLSPGAQDVVLFITGRVVSVVAAAATLVAVHICASDVFGRRAGISAAATLALVTPFVFYAKAANPEIAYVCWFAWSLVFYMRALQRGGTSNVIALAVLAVAAICTKDQAYGLYVSIPFVLAYRARGDARLNWSGLAIAAVAAGALFIALYDIPLNPTGLLAHVHDITGPGRAYRMFSPSVRGEWRLLSLSASLDERSWGWPLLALSLLGAVLALRDRRTRMASAALTLTAGTYYITFVSVILYNYDRYLLPICIVQAIFAGVAVDVLMRARDRVWGRTAVAIVFAYSVLYAATVDVLMLRDSRYATERWLDAHAPRGTLVATAFPQAVEPRLQHFDWVDIGSIENLQRWRPDYFVVNADYAHALEPGSTPAVLVDALEHQRAGYRLVFQYRAASPWPWLPAAHPDLVGARDDRLVASFLRDVNPTMEIFERMK